MEKNELVKLCESGHSSYSIANIVGLSPRTVRYWLAKFQLKTINKSRIKSPVEFKGDFRKCTYCTMFLPQTDFYLKTTGKSHTFCKKCLSSKNLERQREVKMLAVEYKGGKCENCSYDRYVGALEFHHIDPKMKDKKWENFKGRKFDHRMRIELDKCKLLCSNCHIEEHFYNRNHS